MCELWNHCSCGDSYPDKRIYGTLAFPSFTSGRLQWFGNLHKMDDVWQQHCYYFWPSLYSITLEWRRISKRNNFPLCLERNRHLWKCCSFVHKRKSLPDQFDTLIRRSVEGGLMLRYWTQLNKEALLRSRTKSDENGSNCILYSQSRTKDRHLVCLCLDMCAEPLCVSLNAWTNS
jgi:hypothetical protein